MTPQTVGPVLETDRLILRPPQLSDLDRWTEMMGDEDASRFIGGPQTRAVCWRGMMTMVGAWATTGVSMFSVVEKSSDRWMGRIGPWYPDGWPGREVGWALHPDSQGQGYAHEAAVATMDYAFEVLGWDAAIHTINPDNRASIVLAEKLGSTCQGPVRLPAPYEDYPVLAWGQSRDQWRARRGAQQG